MMLPLGMKQAIERDLKIPVGLPTSRVASVTGEGYVILTSGGIKAEGEIVPAFALTEEKSWQMFRREVAKYFLRVTKSSPGGFYLYWRAPPEISSFSMWMDGFDEKEEHTAYSCRARLLISSKPTIDALVQETEKDADPLWRARMLEARQ